jgi:hypothetical protein
VLRGLGALALAAAGVAGCLDAPVASVLPTPTRSPEPTPITTTYELGTTVWYEGLVLHFDRAVAILDERGGPVTVLVTVDNPTIDPAELQARILLVVDGAPVEPTRESRLPTVEPDARVSGELTYELQGVENVDGALIQVGEPPNHIGRVPFTEAGGPTRTLQPRELELRGSATAGDLRIAIRGGLLRWDLPDWAQELAADRVALTVTYDATFTGSFTGGFAFTRENVLLRLPDGTEVAPREDGHSQSVELIGAGRTKEGLLSRFEIPADVRGELTFIVIDGEARKGIPLVIPG